jgi:hypothetical protein
MVNIQTLSYAFDHNTGGPLEKLARACHIPFLQKESKHRDETTAIDDLLATPAQILLVHVGDEAWLYLLKNIKKGKSAIRFSTEGFPPLRPSHKGNGCFHCTKKISDQLGGVTPDEIAQLQSAVSDKNKLGAILKGEAPSGITHLLVFEEPHALRALYMTLMGILTIWASDIRSEDFSKAKKLLSTLGHPLKDSLTGPLALSSAVGSSGDTFKDGGEKLARKLKLQIIATGGELTEPINKLLEAVEAGEITHETLTLDEALGALSTINPLVTKRPFTFCRQTISRFNHDWLKNRLIMTLNAAVTYDNNHSSWDDLLDLLKSWHARRADLESALSECNADLNLMRSFETFKAERNKFEALIEDLVNGAEKGAKRSLDLMAELLRLREAASMLSAHLSTLVSTMR